MDQESKIKLYEETFKQLLQLCPAKEPDRASLAESNDSKIEDYGWDVAMWNVAVIINKMLQQAKEM